MRRRSSVKEVDTHHQAKRSMKAKDSVAETNTLSEQ
jgi:hypothetical protein